MTKLTRDFFARPTLGVAKDLIGMKMMFEHHQAIITETEAYVSENDAACHASRGPTKRTQVMFGPPAHTYVYLIYGMYHCLNFVTEPAGKGAAVLIRGVYLPAQNLHLDGPGKLCRDLGIDRSKSGLDLMASKSFQVLKTDITLPYKTTPRIGISKATEKLWRFVVENPADYRSSL